MDFEAWLEMMREMNARYESRRKVLRDIASEGFESGIYDISEHVQRHIDRLYAELDRSETEAEELATTEVDSVDSEVGRTDTEERTDPS